MPTLGQGTCPSERANESKRGQGDTYQGQRDTYRGRGTCPPVHKKIKITYIDSVRFVL